MNYFDPVSGSYVPSQDLIELTPDGGAAAVKGPAKLYLKANLNSPNPITITSAKGRTFKTRPLGVFWYDAKTGQSQLLAPIHDCVAEFLPPNQAVWRGAFGPLADFRITYTKSAIESDLILLQQPSLPEGWDPSTARLELWHDWTAAGKPAITSRLLHSETDANLRIVMAEPDMTDQILDFCDLWFPSGAAFATDAASKSLQKEPRQIRVPHITPDERLTPVAKTWLTTPSQSILIEGVRWQEVQPQLAALPMEELLLGAKTADRSEWLKLLPTPGMASATFGTIQTARADYRPKGLVLDYITITGGYSNPYTFEPSTTYFVNSPTYFNSTVTFQPGCVVKFNGNYLLMYGAIVCNGTSTNPSLFTDYHESLWGEKITLPDANSACPAASAEAAVWCYYLPSNLSLSYVRFRFAHTALRIYAGMYNTETVSHCTFEECERGIETAGGSPIVNISNSTRSDVTTPMYGTAVFYGSLTDTGNVDVDANHLLDSQDYKYFGRLGTLPGNAAGQLTYRTTGHSPITDQPIWSVRSDPTYEYNTSCWLYGVTGFTAFSPWNNANVGGSHDPSLGQAL